MNNRLISHMRSNAVAYLALFLALGGTSYAVADLPAGSVGTQQLRDGAVTSRKLAKWSITPVELDSRAIGGSIRHWAQVAADGRITSSSISAHDNGIPRDGNYLISWGDAFSTRCVALATTRANGSVLGSSSGYVNTNVVGGHPTDVLVNAYNPQGQPAPTAFSVAVIC